MAQFKINDAFRTEVSELNQACNEINSGFSQLSYDDVKTLGVALEYVAQHYIIKELFDMYKSWLNHDIADLNSMIEEADAMDTAISSSFNSGV